MFRLVSGALIDEKWYTDVTYMMPEIFQKIVHYMKPREFNGIRFTGHGIGGVYAVIAALIFSLRIKDTEISSYIDITVVTFGSPRIGNGVLASYINKNLNIIRVTHTNDYVPRFPLRELSYRHHELEYWIAYPHCDCFNPFEPSSTIDFQVYRCHGFNKSMSDYGENGVCI
ncbi:hypothetical protein G9A89_023132 [Geosiphon pyriformis]|nr:hypothetical protein G9A89_023132 [Geosiphon pyriformis]